MIQPDSLPHTVKQENLASITFGESVKGKTFGDLNFGFDLSSGLSSRLGSCTCITYKYRHSCATTKTLASFNKLVTLTQIHKTTKINSSPNFSAIQYSTTIHALHSSHTTVGKQHEVYG